jgi:hypothetical protein
MTTAYSSRHSSRDDEPHDDKNKAAEDKAKKAKTLPKAPSGGTAVTAAPGYSVVTAVHNELGLLTFPAPLAVIAWSVGGDGAAYPHTALPIDEKALAVGTVQPDGRVLGADGTIYPGGAEWQAALNAEDAAVKAAEAAAKAEADAKADAKTEGKTKAA